MMRAFRFGENDIHSLCLIRNYTIETFRATTIERAEYPFVHHNAGD